MRALAQFVAAPRGTAPASAVQLARVAVLDTVGCALAGAGEDAVRILSAELPPDGGPCTVWADGYATPQRAALLNATAAHALDYDDVDDLLIGHPSAVLMPAVLAVAERTGASGALAAEAYWRGLVMMRALAAGLDVGAHYGRGWHTTATLGVVGAAAAAGTLFGLDVDKAGHALGIAVSRAAGTRQNFGSMTKPLHAGLAAADGVLAASLAQRGFTAGRDQFDGPAGMLSLYAGGAMPTEADRARSAEAIVTTLREPGPAALNVKLFPCCYATHAPADAAIELAPRVDAAEIDSVRIAVPDRGLQPLNSTPPRTGLEGKFHMGHVIAASLIDGELGFESFTDAAVDRPEIRQLAMKVTSSETLGVEGAGGLTFAAEVEVTTRDGHALRARCDAPRGHARRQAAVADVLAKFHDCVAFGGVSVPLDLGERLLGLPEADTVAAVFAASRTETAH